MKPEYNVRHGIVRSKVEVDAAMEAKQELRHEEVPKPRAMQPAGGGGKRLSFGGKTYCD